MDPKLLRKVQAQDKLARMVITGGGLTVIATVIAILFLIVKVTLPLFLPTRTSELVRFTTPESLQTIMAVGVDEYLENGFLIDNRGTIAIVSLPDGGKILKTLAVDGSATIQQLADEGDNLFTALRHDNTVDIFTLSFAPVFRDKTRTIEPALTRLAHVTLPPGKTAVASHSRRLEEGGVVLVTLCTDNTLIVQKQVVSTSLFGDETREDFSYEIAAALQERLTAFTVDADGARLYAGTDGGTIIRWDISDNEQARLIDTTPAFHDRTGISSLAMVYGSVSLAVGATDGSLTTWMELGDPSGTTRKLRRIHVLNSHSSPVATIIPSRRDKSLISIGANGTIHWDHMTSENNLLTRTSDSPVRLAALAGRNNGLLTLNKDDQVTALRLDCPHPEVSFKTLFGKVWYESYPEPDYVWQSSAGSDDFEPKFSITPLLFGTIKGTFYAMLLAVPLAIFGAVYVSQFSRGRFKRFIKPAIEIMASIPSVVIGFLAALWLAPLVEDHILTVFSTCVLVPLFFTLFMLAWQKATEKSLKIRHMRKGYEFLIITPIIIMAVLASMASGPILEQLFFQGDFKHWLFNSAGVTYDQRNCIIIAFALGFTVIPIIFSIAEDALSNVPPSLAAASLALGASRWQTVWRVILPSASPGIFAGIMIGFGRAVGETMIVLMATGNTPIMDWSIFNGMRTLSANIAVEIPEAPVDGTLYRVLFLCAVILFAMTFILNTGAELIREHLRKKYMRY